MADPVRELNNYLQSYPGVNLTTQFSWEMRQTGPEHQVIHQATAKFRGVPIGSGTGLSKGLAKANAAPHALQYLRGAYPY